MSWETKPRPSTAAREESCAIQRQQECQITDDTFLQVTWMPKASVERTEGEREREREGWERRLVGKRDGSIYRERDD